MLPAPWDTVLFLCVIPILIQGYKIYKDKGGKPLSKLALQIISIGVSIPFVLLSGGFILPWPVFPIWGGEIMVFAGAFFIWAAELIAVVGLAFGALMALYEVVYKRIYESIGFAPKMKVVSRKAVGFWA